MLLIFLAIVCASIMSWACFAVGEDQDIGTLMFVGALGAALCMIAFVGYALTSWQWFAAEHKVGIINAEYGTAYTQEQVFWASDVIDTVRQLDRKRIQVQAELQNKNLNVELMNPSCMR